MRIPLREVAMLFLRLGFTAFGGPAAHIAMMENEVVHRRKWMSRQDFLDLLGLTNLIPGPNSTQAAIFIGYRKAGIRGLVVGGVCFILPAAAITLLLAYLYVAYGTMPHMGPMMTGIRSAIIAVILGAVSRLGLPMVKNGFLIVLGAAVTFLSVFQVNPLVLLAGSGFAGILWASRGSLAGRLPPLYLLVVLPVLAQAGQAAAGGGSAGGATLSDLGLFFLKIGSILYGSGYVLVAFLQDGLVISRHWLTQTQLLDAVAIGQFTPGPVLSTATFIGYLVLGMPGALTATGGIFLPSFLFVFLIGRLLPGVRKSVSMGGFLDGVNAAALGLMLAACITLGLSALQSVPAWIVFALAAIVQFVWSPNSAWIVTGAALLGWLLSLTGF